MTYIDVFRASVKLATRIAAIPNPCSTNPEIMIDSVLRIRNRIDMINKIVITLNPFNLRIDR